jgi:hypothetical protein
MVIVYLYEFLGWNAPEPVAISLSIFISSFLLI